MSAKRARASAARKVSRRGSRRGFVREFRIGVSGKGFTQGRLRLPPFLCGGIAPQLRSATPPSAEKPPERRDAARPSLEHQNAAQPQTSQRRTSPSTNTALHIPQAPRRCTPHQDATLPTKTLRCPPRCRVAPSAAMLRASEHRSAAHSPNGKSSPMFAVRLRKRTHDSRIHAEFPGFYSQYAAARSFGQRTSASFCQIEALTGCVGRAMLPC